MTHHPHVSHHRPKTTESEADNYDEDDFEEASYDSEDQPNTSTQASPEKPAVAGLNLASYLDAPPDKDLKPINIDTAVADLEGVYPKTGDKDQIMKRLNLGYTEALTPKGPLQASQSNQELRSSKVVVPTGSPVKIGLSFETPFVPSKPVTHSNDDDEIGAIYRRLEIVQDKHEQQVAAAAAASNNGKSPSQSKQASSSAAAVAQAENAARVDALLTELFPEKMEKIRGGKKKNKQPYGLGAVRSHDIAHYINQQNHNQAPSKYHQGISGNVLGEELTAGGGAAASNGGGGGVHDANDASSPLSIEQQIRALRKELKTKEEKLARVTEHSMMMAAHMDKLKGENALLSQKLHEAHMELEAKEARLAETLKQRKKASKKAAQKESEGLTSLETENHQLREREAALMDAVEELSIQNQDLIMKLKESMQRELELSSKRAAMVSTTVANITDNNHLPHINRALYNEGRSQSEPSDGVASKKGAKKRK